MKPDKPIPTVLFYGDPEQPVTPDLLHCEPLSLRSRQHQFKIGPHRHHGLSQIFFLKNGSGKAFLDGDPTTVKAPCLIIISEMCVHHFEWSQDIEGKVISVAAPVLNQLEERLSKEQLVIKSTMIMTVRKNQKELENILDLLFSEYEKTAEDARSYAMHSLIHLFGIWLERNAPSKINTASQQSKSADYLNRYTQLVNKDFDKHRKLESYANELGITAPYLNNLCQQLINKNAQQVVHERLILEAKRHLIYTVLSISQIAYELGFSDPAYFTRFFKRMTGVSPKAFRNIKEPK